MSRIVSLALFVAALCALPGCNLFGTHHHHNEPPPVGNPNGQTLQTYHPGGLCEPGNRQCVCTMQGCPAAHGNPCTCGHMKSH